MLNFKKKFNFFVIFISKNRIKAVKSTNDSEELNFSCKHLILEASYVPLELFRSDYLSPKQISKCVLITDKSIFSVEDNNENVIFMWLSIEYF
jgi:hypothetical protein